MCRVDPLRYEIIRVQRIILTAYVCAGKNSMSTVYCLPLSPTSCPTGGIVPLEDEQALEVRNPSVIHTPASFPSKRQKTHLSTLRPPASLGLYVWMSV